MASLERNCFALPWSEQQCSRALRQKSFQALGAFFNHDLAAYLSFYQPGEELEILNLAVEQPYRRQGLAQALLETVLQYARKMAILNVILEVRESNYQAKALYLKCGFNQCGVRKHYYPDSGEDALIFAKII